MNNKIYKLLSLLSKNQLNSLNEQFNNTEYNNSLLKSEIILVLSNTYENIEVQKQYEMVSTIAKKLGYCDLDYKKTLQLNATQKTT